MESPRPAEDFALVRNKLLFYEPLRGKRRKDPHGDSELALNHLVIFLSM